VRIIDKLSETNYIRSIVGHKKRGNMVGLGAVTISEDGESKKNSKKAKLKAKELKKVEAYEL